MIPWDIRIGDTLLRSVAQGSVTRVCGRDQVGRQGRATNSRYCFQKSSTRRMPHALVAPHRIAGAALQIAASIGASLYSGDGRTVAVLIQCPDAARYRAKEKSRNNYQFFRRDMTVRKLATGAHRPASNGKSAPAATMSTRSRPLCCCGSGVGRDRAPLLLAVQYRLGAGQSIPVDAADERHRVHRRIRQRHELRGPGDPGAAAGPAHGQA